MILWLIGHEADIENGQGAVGVALIVRLPEMLRRVLLAGEEGDIRQCRIGRESDNDIVLSDPMRSVSRRHAEVRPSGGSWIVNDLGSTNGIKINGRRADGPQSIRDGDVIELGTSRVTFELE